MNLRLRSPQINYGLPKLTWWVYILPRDAKVKSFAFLVLRKSQRYCTDQTCCSKCLAPVSVWDDNCLLCWHVHSKSEWLWMLHECWLKETIPLKSLRPSGKRFLEYERKKHWMLLFNSAFEVRLWYSGPKGSAFHSKTNIWQCRLCVLYAANPTTAPLTSKYLALCIDYIMTSKCR